MPFVLTRDTIPRKEWIAMPKIEGEMHSFTGQMTRLGTVSFAPERGNAILITYALLEWHLHKSLSHSR